MQHGLADQHFKTYEETKKDLMNGLLVLQYLMERQRIPIFESVSVALHCTSKVMALINEYIRIND